MKRDEKSSFVMKIRRYIKHKEILFKHVDCYGDSERRTALAYCKASFKTCFEQCNFYDLRRIANVVLMSQEQLTKLLPQTSNPSYESSVKNLTEIIEEAKKLRA